MREDLGRVTGRFPDREDDIRQAWQTNAAFEALVRRHREISDRLGGRSAESGAPDPARQVLRRRQTALEEEMLAIMDQSSRV